MKKKMSSILVVAMMFAIVGMTTQDAQALTGSANTVVNLGVTPYMNVNCTAAVTMGPIAGYGKSNLGTNTSVCTVGTNNTAGYTLALKAQSAVNMTSGSDNIAPITAAGAVPVTWDATAVPVAASGWGFRLAASSTSADAKWGTDTGVSGVNYTGTDAKWYKAAATDFTLASRGSETNFSGDTENIMFGAEVGTSMMQPTGTYTNTVVVTGTTI